MSVPFLYLCSQGYPVIVCLMSHLIVCELRVSRCHALLCPVRIIVGRRCHSAQLEVWMERPGFMSHLVDPGIFKSTDMVVITRMKATESQWVYVR